jgi:hypothetical protein
VRWVNINGSKTKTKNWKQFAILYHINSIKHTCGTCWCSLYFCDLLTCYFWWMFGIFNILLNTGCGNFHHVNGLWMNKQTKKLQKWIDSVMVTFY